MRAFKNSTRLRLAAGIALAVGAGAVAAQTYPTRPVRLVTATPGGGNDFLARIVAPGLSTVLGQQVIVDNRVSRFVGGIVARATPDGYTLVVGGSTMQFLPLTEKMDYDMFADFAPISLLERSPNVLVVQPSLPVTTVQQLIALAKTKPGGINAGTGGPGGSLFLAVEQFKLMTGVNIATVPYKSTGPALLGLLTGEVQLVFATPGGAMAHVKEGRLRALGVTSAKPFALIPGVPTIASAGLRDFELETIGFIMAPAKTPQPIIKLLNQQVAAQMSQNDVKVRLAGGGSEAVSSTPEVLTATLKAEDVRMRKLFKHLGMLVEK